MASVAVGGLGGMMARVVVGWYRVMNRMVPPASGTGVVVKMGG